jgi:hypothetical protein
VSSGEVCARRGDRVRSYRGLAEEVFSIAGPRRICLFHVSNSYSGTFGFYRDRSALEFDDAFDPRGDELMKALRSSASDVVLGPAAAIDRLDPAYRADLAIVWSGIRDDDRASPEKAWVLCERRTSGGDAQRAAR